MQVAVDAVEKERKAEGEEEAPAAAAAAASSADADADAVVEAKTELDAEATESASTMRQAVEDKVLSFVNSAMVVLTIKKILAVLKRPATANFVGIVAKQIEAQGQWSSGACHG